VSYTKAHARAKPRRYRGYHMPPDRYLSDFLWSDGQVWTLYLGSPAPGALKNVKLVAETRRPRKANFWLLWTGKRISDRTDGKDLRTNEPALFERVTVELKGLEQHSMGFVPDSRAGRIAASERVEQSPTKRSGPFVPRSEAADDGADLI
jgi:hypothetical protein